MEAPILATKLYIPPPRPKVVPRPQLLERLNEGLYRNHGFGRKLTLISAPAGFGKTTLIADWGLQLGETTFPHSAIPNPRLCWLSLDEGDNDPARFLAYLVAALQTGAPQLGEGVLTALQSSLPSPTEFLLTILLNELASLPDNLILVLDDYHTIDTPAVDEALTFLVEHLPPQLHLVIASREDPQLPLAQLRVRGEVVELRAADLRFTPTEAAKFLNQVMGLNLGGQDIGALESRTEGWIAGLQLAALALRGHTATQGHSEQSRFITSFTGSHRFVVDYLVEQVLQQQPEGVQNFLLCTSILDRMCGPLCDAVLGRVEGSGMEDQATSSARSSSAANHPASLLLEALERANLFIIPLDSERRWYRYHHLFAELLRQRLHEGASSARGEEAKSPAQLHIRASDWFERNGLQNEAFQHAVAAQDFERAARVAEIAWPVTFSTYFKNTLFLDWMKALPEELVRSRPVLSIGYAWALLDVGELEAAGTWLRDAECRLDTPAGVPPRPVPHYVDEELFNSLPAYIALARSYIAIALGDVPGCVKQARRALADLPEGNHHLRGSAAALLGLAHLRSGELESAYTRIAEGMAELVLTGNVAFALSGTGGLAEIRVAQGRLHDAVKVYEHALRLATSGGERVVQGTADLYLGLSGLYLAQGDIEAAREHLQKSDELGAQAGLPDWQYRATIARFRIINAEGDLDGALDLLGEAEELYYRTPLLDAFPVAALKARVWVRQGRVTHALGWAQERALSIEDELSYPLEFEHITLARVLLAQCIQDRVDGPLDEALKLLGRLQSAAEQGGRMGSLIEILVVQALAYDAQGNVTLALASLERALALAEPQGYVRVFVDEGQPMLMLLSQAGAQGFMAAYLAKLLAAFEEPTEDKGQGTKVSSLVEPLSPRELEILQLIAQGLSNQEIAERLYLALSTVKGHNRVIFDKLQVQSRTEAVARARDLGLL